MKYTVLAASLAALLAPNVWAATYKLEELGTKETAKHGYVTAFNNNGEAIGVTRGEFSLKIDNQIIDYDDSTLKTAYNNQKKYEESINKTITFTLDDIKNGTINADALTFVMSVIQSRNRDPKWQKISDQIAVDFSSPVNEVTLFDIPSVDFDGLTRSTTNYYTAITEDGVKAAWGTSPYSKITFTPEGKDEVTYFVRDFEARGLVISASGEQTALSPIYDTHGGVSIATDIKQLTDGSYVVVGDSSIGIPEDRQKNLDDNCDNKDEPTEVCIWSFKTADVPLFDRRASLWRLDSNLNVTSVENLGLALTPKEDEGNAFRSSALGVNSSGIAVGYSDMRWKEDNGWVSQPVYFNNGVVTPIVTQDKYYRGLSGKAVDINDNNIITGYHTQLISGVVRTKFFYHNIATSETVFPTDFFSSSSSTAHDINNAGFIVGEGEVETSTSSNRRREGFLYDLNSNTFTNVNNFLPCYDTDGKTAYPYVVGEAIAINDNNEIIGSATKTVKKRDSLGQVTVDSTGKEEFESIVVPVKLTPITGSIESCPPTVQQPYERQGGSLAWLSFLLFPLVTWRRRR
ncbi:DUF3466 family protein [Pseudoalteromonas tunicata]|uniref:Putative orphan protein n=1 Tax=Pseudoalteromonas tunicata D2 TaxID=87626 RepID=A4CC96_9GAMM|nr:DUF3466 family protein [Pseudoalteromonas tunicata]ATC94531.1 hypothetical protein PTUN_a1984 [Pseudoalteromonas tunicata]AXT30258.1 DUF3466 family protein [Pseudoalteromonas tunicata]EAR27983.1 putative orphan protein [Pseudoalteromonas tunicata D2]